jgi:hypothetical protein
MIAVNDRFGPRYFPSLCFVEDPQSSLGVAALVWFSRAMPSRHLSKTFPV